MIKKYPKSHYLKAHRGCKNIYKITTIEVRRKQEKTEPKSRECRSAARLKNIGEIRKVQTADPPQPPQTEKMK